ncbi:hypothetical protein LPJGGPFB_05135 [Ensifer adhaerens]|uniref:hypothetical protein n=1 Tax=Ensifer adhaerens TaxID=106592 RepID=UPI00156828B8|nr:hypothetical protein [Ensifer adhaerens]NRP21876.1 hypothetical protein [Ensifer adhaerens]
MKQSEITSRLKDLAAHYITLGGQRKTALDDNEISLRLWETEPPEAERFWQENIASLPRQKREELETFLPTINHL